ncbi:MAG: alkaline phosphatase family protein [Actinomycetota bacterium]
MRSFPRLAALALALTLAFALSPAPETVAVPTSSPSRIVVILMENKMYSSIIGSASAPYLNHLAKRNVLLTRYFAVSHPSLPNYLTLTGGSTFGISSDCTTCFVDAGNLASQLSVHGISWRAYMQSMPSPCYKGASSGTLPYEYAAKHDPFMHFLDIRNTSLCNRVVPFSRFSSDLANGLPSFSWISPNECYDMHSCSIAKGDAWLHQWVPKILQGLGPSGILIIDFDEGGSGTCCSVSPGGGQVPAVIAGPGAANGVRIGTSADHYSILRLIEDAWSLPRLRIAGASSTPSIKGWRA